VRPHSKVPVFCFLGFFFFFVVLGFEVRAYTLCYSTSPFLRFFFFFELGSQELFVQADFEPRSS
jgi:hypothetical protein